MTGQIERVTLERLTLLAPIASSLRFDMASLLSDGLIKWGQQVGVIDREAAKWRRLAEVTRESGMVFDADSSGGAGLPDSLAVRELSSANGDGELLARINQALDPLEIWAGELRCYDFGALVLRLSAIAPGGLELDAGDALQEVAVRARAVAAEQVGLKAWARDAISELRRNTSDAWVRPDDLSGGQRPAGVWASPDDGQLFWFHRIPSFRSSTPAVSLCDAAEELFRLDSSVALQYPDHGGRVAVFPGNGHSVVVSDSAAGGESSAEIADRYSRIVALQSAYWTLGQELGSRILWVSNRFSLMTQAHQIGRLREEADRLIWLNQEFTLYQSLLNEHVVRLAPDDLVRWERLASAWGLAQFLQQLDKRLVDFAQLGERFLQRLQEEATSRLNGVVMVLTIVSGVSAIAALVAFATGAALRRANTLNIVIIVIAAIAITTLVLSLTLLRFSRTRLLAARGGDRERPFT